MAKVTGGPRHSARLKKISGPAIVQALGRAVFVASDELRAEAHRSITAGSTSGKFHVPSLPGEPPNNDTGVLVAGITNKKTGPVSAEVRSSAPYSAFLEYGTSKMAERPFMRPAAKKIEPKLTRLTGTAVNLVIRRA